ncbi:hypothetical protein [Legionella oakridgensis]|uniref:Uncharacterized protein n=2 Tax=Legionella oakridgensis TaxID=29423 RepID=W0BB56_9GAMM|nr:hypothetical protein [Legionella oakridgensis]AHE65926.1 hypothetical protein Loa_00337 [Legionella oakridgensis ATCC 33761 = DSM 21215]ETO94301.1 hypothetical protein LOR_8c00600 [Legionella oakridgensis RV-2-2007]KTD43779.1 hypothetical protein Loak_0329 [Legionella oakridgensis]STY15857.1 Uncharacterised protein [Legionella longbeachae]
MKGILLKAILILLTVSFPAFADKIIITGQPIVLEDRDDVYYVPANYSATTAYNYVTINGVNRVCYLEQQPTLAGVDMITINVEVNGVKTPWNCYAYSTEYFEVTP